MAGDEWGGLRAYPFAGTRVGKVESLLALKTALRAAYDDYFKACSPQVRAVVKKALDQAIR